MISDNQCSTFFKNIVLRLALGGMLLLYGVAKFKMGVGSFAEEMSGMFAETIIPVGFAKAFLMTVPLIEVVLGTLLLIGLYTRYAAEFSALLFALFIIGLTSTGNNDLILMMSANYIYIYAAFILTCHSHTKWSVDHLLCKGGKCKY